MSLEYIYIYIYITICRWTILKYEKYVIENDMCSVVSAPWQIDKRRERDKSMKSLNHTNLNFYRRGVINPLLSQENK